MASRAGAGWREQILSSGVIELRDVQAVISLHRTVVVSWAQWTRSQGGRVIVAAGPAGSRLRVVAQIPVGNAFSAYPRLVLLSTGRALLAYRDAPAHRTSALRLRTVTGTGVSASRTIASHVGPLGFAAAGRTGAFVWLAPYAGRPVRTMYARRVDAVGRPLEAAYVVTRAASGSPRVAGGLDGRVLASWLRRGTTRRPAAAVTRSLWPVLRPARIVATPDGSVAPEAPALDLAHDGSAALSVRTFGGTGGPFFHVVGAASWMGGEWARRVVLSASAPMVGSASAVALGGLRSLAVWAEAVAVPGPATYRVVAAERDAAAAPVGAQILTSPFDHGDGRGVAVTHAGSRILVAYPVPTGGFAVSERAS